jgi:parallel beta-helix repeat protein
MGKINRWITVALLGMVMAIAGPWLAPSQLHSVVEAATIYVPGDYSTIQDAIDNAYAGDEVLVSDGTYPENINFIGKAITVRSVNGPNVTIIDGGFNESVVKFINNEGVDSVLEGFTIQRGLSTLGGGILCEFSSPTITDCIIKENRASSGAGIYCDSATPTISNCTIILNLADDNGGGVYYLTSSPSITKCNIGKNRAWGSGGGIYCNNSDPTITNCTITGNEAYGLSGGGIECFESSPTITNCTFSRNVAAYYGGAIGFYYSSSTVVNSIFWQDMAFGVDNEISHSSSPFSISYSNIDLSLITGYGGLWTSNSGSGVRS